MGRLDRLCNKEEIIAHGACFSCTVALEQSAKIYRMSRCHVNVCVPYLNGTMRDLNQERCDAMREEP